MGTMMSVSILASGTLLTRLWFRGVLGLIVAYPLTVVIGMPLAWWAHKSARAGLARASLFLPLIILGVFIVWTIVGLLTS
jgi:hypothetical protein